MHIICYLLSVYLVILFIWVVSSWVAALGRGQVGALGRQANRLVSPLVDPLVRPLRNILPPVRTGSMGFDLSPMLLFVIVIVLQLSIC
jgi:YggT family protein